MERNFDSKLKMVEQSSRKWLILTISSFTIGIAPFFLGIVANDFFGEYSSFFFGILFLSIFIGGFCIIILLRRNTIIGSYNMMKKLGVKEFDINLDFAVGKMNETYWLGIKGITVLNIFRFKEKTKTDITKIKMKKWWFTWQTRKMNNIRYFEKELFCRIPTPDGTYIEGEALQTSFKYNKIGESELESVINLFILQY